MSSQQNDMKVSAQRARFKSQYQDRDRITGFSHEYLSGVVKKAVIKYARGEGYTIKSKTKEGKIVETVAPEHRDKASDMYDRLYTVVKLNEFQLVETQVRPNQSYVVTEDDLVYALYRVALFIKNFPEVKDALDKIYLIPSPARRTIVVFPHYALLTHIFMERSNLKYYRFSINAENVSVKSVTVHFYVEGIEQSLDFTVFVSDLALTERVRDKYPTGSPPNLTVMLCKQALRQGLVLYFPRVVTKMAIGIDNFIAEEDYFANNNVNLNDSREVVFAAPKTKPAITNPQANPQEKNNPQQISKANNTDLIRELFLNISSKYNEDVDFVKFLGNHIKEMFNIAQIKLSDPSIPVETQNAIVDFLSEDANVQAIYEMYIEQKTDGNAEV
jgi:preprotein translocase subunit Sec63